MTTPSYITIPPLDNPHSGRRIAASALRAMTAAHIPWATLHAEGLDAMVLAGLEAVYLQGRTDAADPFIPLVLSQPAEPAEHDGIDCVRCKYLKCDACKTFVSGVHLEQDWSGARGCYVNVARCHDPRACEGRGGMRA